MSAFHQALNKIFGVLWTPFENLNPWIPIWVFGAGFGVLALIAMKYFSNQKRIEEVKRSYQADVLAIKLFRDDLRVVLVSMGRTLWGIACYLGHNLRPMAVLIVPFFFLFAQMQMRLAYVPHEVGERVLIVMDRDGKAEPGSSVELARVVRLGTDEEATEAVVPAGTAVDLPDYRGAAFPVEGRIPGSYELVFQAGDETVRKAFHVRAEGDEGTALAMLSPLRSNSLGDQLLYPTEPEFDASSSFQRIETRCGIRPLPAFGFSDLAFGSELGMGLWFVVISILFAFLLKGFFGVTF